MNTTYYTGERGQKYFDMRVQRRATAVQEENASIFLPFMEPHMTVLDFGCGTGGILNALPCSSRLGVEVNEPSIAVAAENGIRIFRSLDEAPAEIADLVISHHAIEHVPEPLTIIAGLYRALKPGHRAVIVVPAEEPRRRKNRRWHPNADKHLYSWNPVTLGNLMELAGFHLELGFLTPASSSRYIQWARPVPGLYRAMKRFLAILLSRHATVCVGRKEHV